MVFLDCIKISFSRNQAFLVLFSLLLLPAVLVSIEFYFTPVIIYFRLVSVVTEGELLFTEKKCFFSIFSC